MTAPDPLVPAAIAALSVLSIAGLLPAIALVGLRWITFPLVPLTGAVIAATAATVYLAAGGTFMGWFAALAVLCAAAVGAFWVRRPAGRPWNLAPGSAPPRPALRGNRLAGAIGAAGIAGACIWCLKDLSSPTVGFDARTFWLMRSGWLLHSHRQLLIAMRTPILYLGQTGYPPLVSASAAVAWSVTGDHTMRLGVVVIALLDTCALATAAFAFVELGRRFSAMLSVPAVPAAPPPATSPPPAAPPPAVPAAPCDSTARRSTAGLLAYAPMIAGIVAAVLLVFISFGITEPFMTNGYADPTWSLTALGAIAYGLQATSTSAAVGPVRGATGNRSGHGVVAILLLAAGMSKNEGVVIGAFLIVLVAARRIATVPGDQRARRWWRTPAGVAVAELVAVGAWPTLIRMLHARGGSTSFSPPGAMVARARATFDGFAPYLHVLVLAIPIAVVGGLVLSKTRNENHAANDWWGWAGLAGGLFAIGGALTVGSGAIAPWLAATVHRVTEFPALTGWWIVATWAVVASGAPATTFNLRKSLSGAGQHDEGEGCP
ncbi:MAG: hypothetical protein ACYCV7_13460 [Acidimicrobiales bacterium]